MALASVFALALALAMDATAVAAARGLAAGRVRARDVALVALAFGGAQSSMAVAGWWLGDLFGDAVEAFDHWIAFTLLALIGAKMIVEAVRGSDDADVRAQDAFALRPLLVLSIATSIDAFAAGITLPLLALPPLLSAAAIGVVTAATSGAGALLGARVGARFGKRLELLGGVVLCGLGVKVLLEHLLA